MGNYGPNSISGIESVFQCIISQGLLGKIEQTKCEVHLKRPRRSIAEKENTNIPKFVSVVAITLGCLDLVRGFMHTIMLDFAATNIAGLDLSTSLAGDLLQQMGAFGISNYLTGIMLILIGWKARPLALAMLGIIPAAYAIGFVGIKINSASYAPSQAAWGGTTFMLVYLAICVITFIAGVWTTLFRKKKEDVIVQA